MAKGDESRQKILRAAEKIFAEKGLAGASVRAITSAAGVNHALIGYYFGSKVALYQEVLERASKLIGGPKLEKLAVLRAHYGDSPIPLRELIDAYIRSFFDDYGNAESLAITWLRFYGRCFSELDDEVRHATNLSSSPIRSVFLDELQLTLPGHSNRELVYRLGGMIGMITFWRAETGIMDDHLEQEEQQIDVDNLVEELISMCCAAFSARAQKSASNKSRSRRSRPKTAQAKPATDESKVTSLPEKKRSRRHRKRMGTAG